MLRRARAGIRDWIGMTVLAWWLRSATEAQLLALGKDLIGLGVEMQNGWTGPVGVEIVTTSQRADTLEYDQRTLLGTQKWVA